MRAFNSWLGLRGTGTSKARILAVLVAALSCPALGNSGQALAQVGSALAQMGSGGSPSNGSSPAGTGTGQLSANKKADPGFLGGNWYGTAELRHHLNTYYTPAGYYGRQDPSLHARLQVGSLFYSGIVDAYATLGVFKEPHSQQVLQRRPEIAADLYPFKNDYFSLMQYNLVQIPVAAANAGPQPQDERDVYDDYGASTTYMIGMAPTAKLPLVTGAGKIDMRTGIDSWTKLYSRKQYTGTYNAQVPNDDDDAEGHLGLTHPVAAAPNAPPIEDYALHYQGQALAAINFSPALARSVNFETSVHYHSRFDPAYTEDMGGNVSYKYAVYRYSYYQLRLHYDINDRVALVNDFYHFHEGFFAANRDGDERRYRNILRLSCRL